MVKEIRKKGKKYFKCNFCKVLHQERKLAEEHEASCKKYNAQMSELNKMESEIGA